MCKNYCKSGQKSGVLENFASFYNYFINRRAGLSFFTTAPVQEKGGKGAMSRKKTKKAQVGKQKFSWNLMWKQRYLLAMSLPFVIWLIIFKYIPLWGWTMAFQDVKPKTFALSFWEREFVGFENFIIILTRIPPAL